MVDVISHLRDGRENLKKRDIAIGVRLEWGVYVRESNTCRADLWWQLGMGCAKRSGVAVV